MAHIAIQELLPGARLAEDIRDSRGQVLIPKGSELTLEDILFLKKQNIEAVPITLPDKQGGDPLEEIESQPLKQARAVVNHRFRYVEQDHLAVQIIKNHCLLKMAEKLARNSVT